jgi:hypothetical protein
MNACARFLSQFSSRLVRASCLLPIFLFLAASPCLAAYILPATGQTKCYDNTTEITCPDPGKAFYGQDSQYQAGSPMAYQSNVNGTVTDLVTGLIWQQSASGTARNYSQVQAYCSSYSPDGATDWRVPSLQELATIIDYSTEGPVWKNVFFGSFSSGGSGYFSSQTYVGDTTQIWGVQFYYGQIEYDAATATGYVRCVRGAALPTPSLVASGGDSLLDESTGLIWQKTASQGPLNWENALAYCENATTDNNTDWRLPNRRELASIIDFTRQAPAFSTLFTGASASYWTSSTRNNKGNNGWYVDFRTGYSSYYYLKTYENYVRCVRGGSTLIVTAVLSGVPDSPTSSNKATITVGGTDVVAYRYKLDDGNWSDEISISTPITLTGLPHGEHTLQVLAKGSRGSWQSTAAPTEVSWTVLGGGTPPGINLLLFN